MSCLGKRVLIGSMFALGLALSPAMAQHEGHGDGHGHGDHKQAEKESSPASLPNCPVMGEPINLAVSTASDDGPVYFCCKACVSKYQANPAKYATKVAAQRLALADRAKVQVTCPISKKPVDQDVFVESNGKRVYFCCKGCVGKYQGDSGKYASALANSYTLQARCPLMDEEIDPAVFKTAANGTNIYFCCKGCVKKYDKNPAKYASKLAAQGFTVKPKDTTNDKDEHAGHDHGSHAGHDHDH